MKKILILGGAGYVGGFLTDLLIENCYFVTVYDNLLYENLYLKNVEFIYGDIRDKNKLVSILPQFDVVVCLAAIVGDGACAVDPTLTYEVNEKPIQWLTSVYNGKLILASTCSVYGINNNLIDESAIPNPLSIYASTKLAAEQWIINNYKDYTIFRLGTLYGLGDEFSRVRFDLVTNILTQRATIGKELCVFGGEQYRPLLHVKDVSYAILHAINYNISGLYNLHEQNYQIKEIAECIASIVPNTKIVYQDIKFEDARNYRVSSDKFKRLGWNPIFGMEDGIKEIHTVIKEGRIKNVHDSIYSNESYLKGLKN